MASPESEETAKPVVKRKRHAKEEAAKKRAKLTDQFESESESDSDLSGDENQARILLLENEILESRKNYNNLVTLIETVKSHENHGETAVVAAVSLCRVFIRLLATGKLVKNKDLSEKDVVVVGWLRDRLSDYKEELLPLLRNPETGLTALTLALRLLQAEAQHMSGRGQFMFPRAFFAAIVRLMVDPATDDNVRGEFMEKYVLEYEDIRFFTFQALRDILAAMATEVDEGVFGNAFDMLSSIDEIPGAIDTEKFLLNAPTQKKHALFSLSHHKKQAQEAWLALMRLGLDKERKKKVLDLMPTSIAPWFTRPELLMDFLTDCYDMGGGTSLLALSGVFYLMRERNLDYPLFYRKLYSLLDADVLHSRHRSRFFRLLDTFLSSSHLPAVMVASFIKRVARLALNAPPAAIVVVVPWFYNLFKRHPLCTFMMHRVPRSQEERDRLESEGMDDPFLPDEEDPNETRAIDSCLWEIVQLQSHYHPNVATIAKIISEQFTKEFYNLEDFLDHSFGSLIEAEMAKGVKKPPVVEYVIPKRIFTSAEKGSDEKVSLLVGLWDFGSS